MKKILILIILSLLLINIVTAQNLYQYETLDLELEVKGEFGLVAKKSSAKVNNVKSELLLFPNEDFRQKLLNLKNKGELNEGSIIYEWNDKTLGNKEFGYTATIGTENQRIKVKNKIPFPIAKEDIQGLEQYLLPTKSIDSDNAKIIAKASELAEGEDDLFKVTFKLAEWVERNVEYDLNTLTATSSQKASWVLENKQGVCDEMTSLLVAMARSLGIPARFVSGISYSTSELFNEPWQPHGWSEVYFPNIGWVSFDITFGEYGYIDVTHIKLRDGFDPSEPATKFEWFASGDSVDLIAKNLALSVNVKNTGSVIPNEILLESEILSSEVDFGSYNLVKGIIKNRADHYIATTLQLATPKELDIIGRNRRTIMLTPNEIRETFWIIKVDEKLFPGYWYDFPVAIYSEKNVSVKDQFRAQEDAEKYSLADIEELTVVDEEKSYSQRISFDCSKSVELKIGEEKEISCTFKNSGNINLNDLNLCLGHVCETTTLPINQKKTTSVTIKGKETGWNKVIVSAENELVEKRSPVQYLVLDDPKVKVNIKSPDNVNYGDSVNIELLLTKDSFNDPQRIVVNMRGPGFDNEWKLNNLNEEEKLVLTIDNPPFSKNNNFLVEISWVDKEDKPFLLQKTFEVKAKSSSFINTIKMFFNGLFNAFR